MKAPYSRIVLVLLVLVIGCGKDSPKPVPPVAPTVVTGAASEITDTGAKIGGEVTSDGKASVTARGIVFSTTPGPTTASTVASSGEGTGTFTVTLVDLHPGTTYYLRAFATNSVGTSYGLEISFATIADPATVTTNPFVSDITGNTAKSGGDVANDGGGMVTARGVCWSTAVNPTIDNNKTTDGSGTGAFVSAMTGLTPSTTYFVRAYATNSTGTSYGQQESFGTGCTVDLFGLVDYRTVVTGAVVSIVPCQPFVLGQTEFSLVTQGRYALADASFGQYHCVWSDNPAHGVEWVVDCNNVISVEGNDQYGIIWSYSIISNDGTNLVLSWTSDYGDAGTSTLQRTGGWPLNLSF